jgi:tetratricopeptide (TPR) repeat protein
MLQAYWRVLFVSKTLGADASGVLKESLPLVGSCRYRAAVNGAAIPAGAREQLRDTLATVRTADMSLLAHPLCIALTHAGLSFEGGAKANSLIFVGSDATAWDAETWLSLWALPRELEPPFLAQLKSVCPDHPVLKVDAIQNDWEHQGAAHAAEWERQVGENPIVAGALAQKYTALGRDDDAIRCYDKFIAKSPDIWAFQELAGIYLRQGDEDRWLSTMLAALKHEDFNLDRPQVLRSIADHLMERGRFGEALPYARQCADSGAEWAMTTYARCLERLGNFDQAEQIIRGASQGYGRPVRWFGWCKRTGHGDVAAARQAVLATIAQLFEVRAGRTPMADASTYYLLDGDTNHATAIMEKWLEDNHGDLAVALQVAFLRQAAGDAAGRDSAMKMGLDGAEMFAARPGYTRPQLLQLGKSIDAFWRGSATVTPSASVDTWIDQANDFEKPVIAYLAGCFYDSAGVKPAAEHFYRRACSNDFYTYNEVSLASLALRERGIDGWAPTTRPAGPASGPAVR